MIPQLGWLGGNAYLHMGLQAWFRFCLLSLLRLLTFIQNVFLGLRLRTRLSSCVLWTWNVILGIQILVREIVLNFECVLHIASTTLSLTLVVNRWWNSTVFCSMFQEFFLHLIGVMLAILDLRTNGLADWRIAFWLALFCFLGRILVKVSFVSQRNCFTHLRDDIGFLWEKIASYVIFQRRWGLIVFSKIGLLSHRVRHCFLIFITVRWCSVGDILLLAGVGLGLGVCSNLQSVNFKSTW